MTAALRWRRILERLTLSDEDCIAIVNEAATSERRRVAARDNRLDRLSRLEEAIAAFEAAIAADHGVPHARKLLDPLAVLAVRRSIAWRRDLASRRLPDTLTASTKEAATKAGERYATAQRDAWKRRSSPEEGWRELAARTTAKRGRGRPKNAVDWPTRRLLRIVEARRPERGPGIAEVAAAVLKGAGMADPYSLLVRRMRVAHDRAKKEKPALPSHEK